MMHVVNLSESGVIVVGIFGRHCRLGFRLLTLSTVLSIWVFAVDIVLRHCVYPATKRLRKGKSVDDGESNGKRTRLAAKPSTAVVGVPVPVKRPQLRIKRTTRFFQRILKSLNERQKTAVRQLGFGGLLDYDVASVPGTLAYWLLEHFDHRRCSLMLPNGVEVVVGTKDAELIFGFPNGGITIDRCDRNTCMKYLETVPLDEEADVNAMQTKTSPCGYVRPRIVDILGDLQKVKKHNWCKYLLDNLLRTHGLWKNNKSKVFSGPVVFLVSFYVDRVVHCRRCVARAIPRIKGWTTELLKEREEVEMKEADFGLGRVTSQLDENEMGGAEMTTEVQRPADEDVADAQDTEDFVEPPPTDHGEPWSTKDVVEEIYTSDEVVYMRGVWGATKHIGDGLKMLAKELNKAPPEIGKKDSFRITSSKVSNTWPM
ncbi:hypothetical protein SASPL_137871 [Salvia splendens]|uniref:Uncharacterized protein n=1 Tax=Salvia splendens TaxID=180675 RepID=A0A8X8WW10_SALSN|nr:hypothetical protein SASPL_137871 [Salvia splendens]